MTYFTYEKSQYSGYKKGRWIHCFVSQNGKLVRKSKREGLYQYSQPPKKIPSILSRPSFMPSNLVRISDMKVIQGSTVHEGYCALSYSWDQSGDIVINETGKKSHQRMDEGKHKIIFPARTIRKKPRGRKRISRKVKFVTFEGLIQEIGKDFNIKYIWYDQMCINQNNDEEKHNEIHHMHKIYTNAYCTVALVPELTTLKEKIHPDASLSLTYMNLRSLEESQWMKRIWTLEETIMSSKILVVGRNVHCWWYHRLQSSYPIFNKRSGLTVSNILYYAHARTSTKEHDHIFALANIVPDIMRDIKIDYKQDFQKLIIRFYGLLAKKDLSILCFGQRTFKTRYVPSINNNSKDASIKKVIPKFDLPSWTGIHGEHYSCNKLKTAFKNYTVIGRVLQVTCHGLTNKQHSSKISSRIEYEDIPLLPQQKLNNDRGWALVISIESPGSTNEKFICVWNRALKETQLQTRTKQNVASHVRRLSHFMPIEKKNLQWIPFRSDLPKIYLDNVTEILADSERYVLLTGIRFIGSDSTTTSVAYCPIIKKDGDYYKAMGTCFVVNPDYYNDIAPEEQLFEIH